MAALTPGSYGGVPLDAEQLNNAAIIAKVGYDKGMSDRAVTIGIATAMQEAGLRNLHRGDRDSQGLFQQRPSQGWGTVAQVTDPVYAAGKFFDTLKGVSGWESMALTTAAQRVQRSATPLAYAKWETMAKAVTSAIGGNPNPTGGGSSAASIDLGSLTKLSDPRTWTRVGMYVGGGVLLVVGLFKVTGDNKLSESTKAVAKFVALRKVG